MLRAQGYTHSLPGKKIAGRLLKMDAEILREERAGLIKMARKLRLRIDIEQDDFDQRGQSYTEPLLAMIAEYKTIVLGLSAEERIRLSQEVKMRKELGIPPVPVLTSEEAEAEAKTLALDVLKQLGPGERAALLAEVDKP